MAQILKTKSIYYNDVNLVAQPCKVKSRKDIPVELNRVIVSPMEAIVGKTFALKANELGLTVCLHRFCSIQEQVELYNLLPNKENVFVSKSFRLVVSVTPLNSGTPCPSKTGLTNNQNSSIKP